MPTYCVMGYRTPSLNRTYFMRILDPECKFLILFFGKGGGKRRFLYIKHSNYWFFFEPAENVLGFKASELKPNHLS